jgi:SAM-dependent methyltransferase
MTIAITSEITQLKVAHRATWAAGDYTAIADAYVGPVARTALAAARVQPGEEVLDVAAGSGNASIPAAQAGAQVTALDLVPELLQIGRVRAEAAGVAVRWVEGDAEALPLPDDRYDAVLSVVGVQFTPRHAASAAELVRVTRPGGRFVLANWTPAGFIGQVFKTMAPYMPKPPAGAGAPPLWGDVAHVRSLFAGHDVDLAFETHTTDFTHDSPAAFVEFMADNYGPVLKARERLARDGRWSSLRADLIALCERANVDRQGFRAPSEYLLIVGRLSA